MTSFNSFDTNSSPCPGRVEAFRSTLEEVSDADLLVHVVDASSSDPQGQIDAVRTVLDEIGAGSVPQLIVFNKADLATEMDRLLESQPGSVGVSALTGDGIDVALQALSDRLRFLANVVELVVPYSRGDIVAAVHRSGEVLVESHEEDATRLRVRLDAAEAGRFREWVVEAS